MCTILSHLLISLLGIEPAIDLPMCTSQYSKQLLYAEQLFDGKIYEASILEYRRFLFYHPHTDFADFADYRIAQGYYHQSSREHAQQLFAEFLELHPNSPLYQHAQLMLSKTHFDNQEYSRARAICFQILHANADDHLLAQAQYLRGWCYVYERNWLKAITEFRKVRHRNGDILGAHLFDADLGGVATQLAAATLTNTPLPLKSPKFAQLLSTVLPGSGQIYAAKVRNGFISAAINAAFFSLLVDSIVDKRYVDALGIYLVGSRFYWGNRFNAKKWAIEHNRKLERRFIQGLKEVEHGAVK